MQDMIMSQKNILGVKYWEYFFAMRDVCNNWLAVHMTQLMSVVGLKY
jgi:hypothetical protein